MRITLAQRLQLGVVFLAIRVLWVVDDIGSVARKSALNAFRMSLYIIIVAVSLTGFYVKTQASPFYNVPDILSPNSSVLGVAAFRRPVLVEEFEFPEITAVSVYAVDLSSNAVLVDVNSDFELAPASTTKLMTALVTLDLYDLEENVVVPEFCTEIEGLKAGFFANDTYTVRNLLYSLLVNSSADAACTLATGKIQYNDFVSTMNTKADSMGLERTFFTNPIGLDGVDGAHYSTAKDLYTLAKEATSIELVKEIVGTKEVTIVSSSGFATTLVNTNELLWTQPGTVGVKTGQTENAGEVLIYEYDFEERNFIISIMRSADRFGDTLKVLDWINSSYSWPD